MLVRSLATAISTAAFITASSSATAAVSPLPAPAPVAALVRAIDIPYSTFTLANGLQVIVHTDRKAPLVAVSVWYDVGSKNEPAGKAGFAHLFEHLMFNGSENAPGDFFEPLKQMGATDYNGTTSYDRTNYYETVPTAALARTLYLESDRMGHLLGAITQPVLDEQRGVVQNEKRQGDNQPYGLLQYAISENLYPAGHPYGHTTIGSMADLDAASLQTVKDWFRQHYGPNNAVLVLAGDIDVAAARPIVERYFGEIPSGPKSVRPDAPVPTLPQARTISIRDRVAQEMLTRSWAVPGLNDPDAAALDVAAAIMGGLSSSRLTNRLVKDEKLFVQVQVQDEALSQGGTFSIIALVRPGVDPALASRRLDAAIADFLQSGPTGDEVGRAVTTQVADRIRQLEAVGGSYGKAVTLAEGALYSGDPGFYRKQLDSLAAQTPASIKAAVARWLSRPVLAVDVVRGDRDAYAEATPPVPIQAAARADMAVRGTRGPLPAVAEPRAIRFPAVVRATLSNGIPIIYAQRAAVPVTQAEISFDAGKAADAADKPGIGQLVLDMMDEGVPGLDSVHLAEARERFGAQTGTMAIADRTVVTLSVPTVNLAGAAELWARSVREPTFPEAELPRVKDQQIARIAQERTDPGAMADRVLSSLIYGAASPYATAENEGDPKAIAAATRDDLIAFQHAWFRPDKAKIFVVSDRPLIAIKPALERAFGGWRGIGMAGVKAFGPFRPATPRIVLVDRPGATQSQITGGVMNGLTGIDDLLSTTLGNDALGGSFLGRLNMNLRENKHWTYGVTGAYQNRERAAPYVFRAPVQSDRTGDSLQEARREIADYITTRPMTQNEFDRAVRGAIRALPGQYETSDAVLAVMLQNDLHHRPDDYVATLPDRLGALTLPQLRAATATGIDPTRFVWVVVGDLAKVRGQLAGAGLPIETMTDSEATESR